MRQLQYINSVIFWFLSSTEAYDGNHLSQTNFVSHCRRQQMEEVLYYDLFHAI